MSCVILLIPAVPISYAAPPSTDEFELIVTDVNTPGIEIFQNFDISNTQFVIGSRRIDVDFTNGTNPQVPEGKRYVVQHASVSVTTDVEGNDARCLIATDATTNQHPLILSDPIRTYSGIGPAIVYRASEAVTLYVEAGDSPLIACIFADPIDNGQQSIVITGTISGYFINIK